MVELGYYSLMAGLVFSLYAVVAAVLGVRGRSLPLVRSAENSVLASFALVLAASLSLWHLLLTNAFQVEYVAAYSAAQIPSVYKFAAFWGGQKGSLLFWALVLGFFASVTVLQNRRTPRLLFAYALPFLSGTLAFFLFLLNFVTPPFELLSRPPADGQGLNPLLQNAYMVIHPPTLYLGYIGLTVPFAFAMAALVSGRLDLAWIRLTRRWTLLTWVFLTLGIALGAIWAYEELGWGGYWAWDPVENASLMPWLVTTAFLHSVMITEKKGMLKTWSFTLILLAFELSIFGTFITRSGVISSVHSFARSNLGPFFFFFLAGTTFLGLFLILHRASALKSAPRMQSFLSREASFLLNNLLFVSIAFSVLWGTVFPMLSEWVRGEKVTVSAPYFNRVNMPLALALLVLTGICPLIAWRKASFKNFRRNFLVPLGAGLATGALALSAGIQDPIPLFFFSAAGFVVTTGFFEFYKGARARQSIRPTGFLTALTDLTLTNKRRYGGYIIHLGVVLILVGIAGSSHFNQEEQFTLRKGESFQVGDYRLSFQGLNHHRDPEKDVVSAPIDVFRGPTALGTLRPQKHFHYRSEQPMTEVAIRSTLKEDLYLVLSGWNQEGEASFHVFLKPMVQLIWLGTAILVLGGLFVLLPNRKLAAGVVSRKRRRRRKSHKEIRDEAA
ncbi:MAG: heme lyase CcmF/NrfE family subunit [Acidobacteriota bacterium]